MQKDSIFPYVVPKEYLNYQRPGAFAKALGHDVHVVLMKEMGRISGNVTEKDLAELRVSADEAYSISLENLERTFKAGLMKAGKLSNGPGVKDFILVAGHWDAAAVALLPRFAEFARKNLGQEEILLSIPHQGVSLVFPAGDREYCKLVKTFVQQHEGSEGKPITSELFTFRGLDLVPLES